MKLINKQIEKKLNQYGLYGHEKFGFILLLVGKWGYVMLSKLESLELIGQIPLIERDLYINKNTTVRQKCSSLGISI